MSVFFSPPEAVALPDTALQKLHSQGVKLLQAELEDGRATRAGLLCLCAKRTPSSEAFKLIWEDMLAVAESWILKATVT